MARGVLRVEDANPVMKMKILFAAAVALLFAVPAYSEPELVVIRY
jgi:hypothetical protein